MKKIVLCLCSCLVGLLSTLSSVSACLASFSKVLVLTYRATVFNLFLVLAAFIGLQQSFAQVVDLGTLSSTNIAGTLASSNYPTEEAFNGLTSGANEGWMGTSGSSLLFWDVNPFENTQVDTSRIDAIQFAITIYTGVPFSSSNGNLQEFYFRYADEAEDFTNVITEFDVLNSIKVPNGEVLAIDSDNDGLITVESSNEQAIYTLEFTVPDTTRRFQIESVRNDKLVFTVEEIMTSASVVVPEPSTYALVLGLTLFGLGVFRCRLSPSTK